MAIAESNRSLIEFALGLRYDDLPQQARTMAVDAMTDCVACILAGTQEPLVGPLAAVVESSRTAEDATAAVLMGTTRLGSRYDAALYNGTLAHAIDYDDTNHPSHVHISSVLVPALFALAADPSISGRDVVTAYVAGVEMVGRLGRALNMVHYKRGWHCTATLGTMGAVVAAATLLRLSPEKFEMAVGIAASSAAGLFANVGTMTKPLHAGNAARSGVIAALLAREGFTSSSEALTHRGGFYRTLNGLRDGENINEEPLRSFGKPLEILSEFGLALKPFPCCGATHTAIEGASVLREQIGGNIDRIKDIRVGVNPLVPNVLIYDKPSTVLEGKFSMTYCVASAMVDGDVGFATFADPERLQTKAIVDMMDRTHMDVDEEHCSSPHKDFTEFPSHVTVTLDDGRKLEHFVPLAIGKP